MPQCKDCKTSAAFHELIDGCCHKCTAEHLRAAQVEIASRGAWISTMCLILGYNNRDGFHSDPSPHVIAHRLVQWSHKVYRTLTFIRNAWAEQDCSLVSALIRELEHQKDKTTDEDNQAIHNYINPAQSNTANASGESGPSMLQERA